MSGWGQKGIHLGVSVKRDPEFSRGERGAKPAGLAILRAEERAEEACVGV